MWGVRQLTCVVATAGAVAVAPAAADAAITTYPLSSVEMVSTGPLPVAAPGSAAVRLRLHGGPEGSAAYLSVTPTAVSVLQVKGYTAAVREAHLEGTGGRVFTPRVVDISDEGLTSASMPSRAVEDQACTRGRYYPVTDSWKHSYYRSIQVDPEQTVDVVATIDVPAGLAVMPAGVTVSASQITVSDRTYPVPTPADPLPLAPSPDIPAVATRAASTSFTIALPRTGPAHDVVTLVLGARDRAGKRVRLRGSVFPPRASAVVEIAGRRTPNVRQGGEVLGYEDIATAPIGPRMRYFGEAKTDANGRWAAWVTLPPRVAVVARTTEVPGVTLGGASCGLWFSSPTLDQRALDAKRKVNAKRRREAEKRNGEPR